MIRFRVTTTITCKTSTKDLPNIMKIKTMKKLPLTMMTFRLMMSHRFNMMMMKWPSQKKISFKTSIMNKMNKLMKTILERQNLVILRFNKKMLQLKYSMRMCQWIYNMKKLMLKSQMLKKHQLKSQMLKKHQLKSM